MTPWILRKEWHSVSTSQPGILWHLLIKLKVPSESYFIFKMYHLNCCKRVSDYLLSILVVIRVPQRNRTKRMCIRMHVHTEREIFEELAHIIVETKKPNMCMVSRQSGSQGRAGISAQSWRQSAGRISSQKGLLFFYLNPSIDWIRPTHIVEVNCFTQSPVI